MCSLQTRGRSFLANACFHTLLAHALGWSACSRTTGATVRTRGQCLAWEGSRDRINSTDVVFQLLLVGPLTECGLVALTDLAKFLETDTGMRLAAKHLVLLPLEPGTVAWVPYGYVCIPSALQTQQSKTTADMVHEVAFVWHLTIFNKSFLQELPAKGLGRHPDLQRPASLQSGFEASVSVEEGHFHKVCSSQEVSCYCNFSSRHGMKERSLHAVNP